MTAGGGLDGAFLATGAAAARWARVRWGGAALASAAAFLATGVLSAGAFLAARAFFVAGAFLVAAAFLGPDTFFAAPFFLVATLAAFLASGGSSASATASSMAVDRVGSANAAALRGGRAGGGEVGVMGQEESMAGSDVFDERRAAFLAALANSAALAGADSGSRFDRVSAVAARLLTPRTGSRCVKIHPTPGTGLPPMSRPSSKSHGCSP